MAFRDRVKADDNVIWHGNYAIRKLKGGKFRVYEDASYYSSVSGGVGKAGNVMRDADGRPIQFGTLLEAETWIDKGCRIFEVEKEISLLQDRKRIP